MTLCKDCKAEGLTNNRPVYQAGRCRTHHRAVLKARRERQHAQRVEKTYGLADGEYGALLTFQGGVCALCGRPGVKKRLAVDHDHKTGEVRGLIHAWENSFIGRVRDSVEWFERAAEYLRNPPARQAGLNRKAPDAPTK